jgi:apolipoprotein D and lipocalin family protein
MRIKILPVLLALGLAACAGGTSYRDTSQPIASMAQVDLTHYAGRWYEIARFPVWFQEGCVGVTAEYALRDDGRVDVLNTCRQGALDGPVETANAVARAVDETNARLKVNFAPLLPVEGDYWILYVDPDYELAVVGSPGGTGSWILARSPTIPPARLADARAVLADNGYDVEALTLTPQPPA